MLRVYWTAKSSQLIVEQTSVYPIQLGQSLHLTCRQADAPAADS